MSATRVRAARARLPVSSAEHDVAWRHARNWKNAGRSSARLIVARRARALERVRRGMARALAGRYPDRARTFRLLFPDRHLHHHQHRGEPDPVVFPSLGEMAVRTEKQTRLERHVARLRNCRRCPLMHPPPVSGGAVVSRVLLVGQAPGVREPVAGKPFAWTAGKTLFRWFEDATGLTEEAVREKIYFAAVCRCFPGKASGRERPRSQPAGDRELFLVARIAKSKSWNPALSFRSGNWPSRNSSRSPNWTRSSAAVFASGAPAGKFDLIPLPHPSGASPWHRIPPGRELLGKALKLIVRHAAFRHE